MKISLDAMIDLTNVLSAWFNKWFIESWVQYVTLGFQVLQKLLPLIFKNAEVRSVSSAIPLDWKQILVWILQALAKLLPIIISKLSSRAMFDMDEADAIAEEIAAELEL